jgi:nicotinamidase-related amidase
MPDALKLDPKTSAVILIDMINAVAKGGNEPPYNVPANRQGVIDNFVRLVAHCRSVGTPLIYITTFRRPDNADAPKTVSDVGGGGGVPMLQGTAAVEVIDELAPQAGDYVIVKPRFSAYYGTNLEGILNALGTETILVGGISTQRSVEGTARDAKNRDTQCVVVSDCCTAGEEDVHEMTVKHVLPLLVRVRDTDEVIAALSN